MEALDGREPRGLSRDVDRPERPRALHHWRRCRRVPDLGQGRHVRQREQHADGAVLQCELQLRGPVSRVRWPAGQRHELRSLTSQERPVADDGLVRAGLRRRLADRTGSEGRKHHLLRVAGRQHLSAQHRHGREREHSPAHGEHRDLHQPDCGHQGRRHQAADRRTEKADRRSRDPYAEGARRSELGGALELEHPIYSLAARQQRLLLGCRQTLQVGAEGSQRTRHLG